MSDSEQASKRDLRELVLRGLRLEDSRIRTIGRILKCEVNRLGLGSLSPYDTRLTQKLYASLYKGYCALGEGEQSQSISQGIYYKEGIGIALGRYAPAKYFLYLLYKVFSLAIKSTLAALETNRDKVMLFKGLPLSEDSSELIQYTCGIAKEMHPNEKVLIVVEGKTDRVAYRSDTHTILITRSIEARACCFGEKKIIALINGTLTSLWFAYEICKKMRADLKWCILLAEAGRAGFMLGSSKKLAQFTLIITNSDFLSQEDKVALSSYRLSPP